MEKKICLTDDELAEVKKIVHYHLPSAKVWIFGSRANMTATNNSDLDLLLSDKEPVPIRALGLLKNDFEDSNLPFQVDVVDEKRISNSFRSIIENEKILII